MRPPPLDRYLTGEASPEERAAVEAWADADPSRRAWLEQLRAFGDTLRRDARSRSAQWADPRAMARALAAAKGPRLRLHTAMAGPGRSVRWRVAGMAAAVVLALGGALAVWRSGWLASGQPFREFASAPGSRTTVTLRDGTTLVLGPATRLRVPRDFGARSRTVDLDGEALLTVVHDARRPFAVQTARTLVRDVGTTFSVRAYRDDPTERIAVAEGAVELGGVSLRAHDGAVVDASGHVLVHRDIDIAHETEWTHGGLAFQNTPLDDVVRELSRVYDVDITIADPSLLAKPITASFGDAPLETVLNVISLAAGAHYERTGRLVVIRPGVAPAANLSTRT